MIVARTNVVEVLGGECLADADDAGMCDVHPLLDDLERALVEPSYGGDAAQAHGRAVQAVVGSIHHARRARQSHTELRLAAAVERHQCVEAPDRRRHRCAGWVL